MSTLIRTLRRAAEQLATLLLSKAELTRRAVLRSEKRERQAAEAERLDRLRNPGDYQGK